MRRDKEGKGREGRGRVIRREGKEKEEERRKKISGGKREKNRKESRL